MRLNFSGSNEEAIREGIRRIGEVVNEQVELYGTLTGKRSAPALPGADVLPMPTPAQRARRARES
jgi:2-aminoadipate transaminase